MGHRQLVDILERLRKSNVISDSTYNRSMDGFKPHQLTGHNYPVNPILLMFNLVKANELYISVQKRAEEIEDKIKDAVVSWESGTLGEEETKRILTMLVSQKKSLEKAIHAQAERLKTLYDKIEEIDGNDYFELEDYLDFLLSNSEIEGITDFIVNFKEVWANCRTKLYGSRDPVKEELVKEVETDILANFTPTLDFNDHISFDLGEILPSFDDYHDSEDIFTREKNDRKAPKRQPTKHGDKQRDIFDPWDYVGKIAFKENQQPLGIIRPPIIVSKEIYFPIVKEKTMDGVRIKKKYKKQFLELGIPIEGLTLHQLRKYIANKLEIPEEMGLQPTFFNKWLTLNKAPSVPLKPILAKVWFIKYEKVKDQKPQNVKIKEEELKTIKISAWVPAPGGKIVDKSVVKRNIYGMAGSNFGTIEDLIDSCPFGQALLIKRNYPPSKILEVFMKGLGMQNIPQLRFDIAKTLGIAEGEVFNPKNMWEINNKERILIAPHDLNSSYYTVLPAKAFEFNSNIQAKPGVYFHSIPETFRYLYGKEVFSEKQEKLGTIFGFAVDSSGFSILWTKKNAEEIIKEVGRKSSHQYVQRFKHRVAMALDIPKTASLWPNNLARYFLNFIWMEEDLKLEDAMKLIEKRFFLQKVTFSDIIGLSEVGIICKM